MSDLRRNVLALGLDYGLFMVGLAFASQTTILPAFAAWLGAPNVLIGAIPAVMTLGWFLPQLFMAAHTLTLPRKLPVRDSLDDRRAAAVPCAGPRGRSCSPSARRPRRWS